MSEQSPPRRMSVIAACAALLMIVAPLFTLVATLFTLVAPLSAAAAPTVIQGPDTRVQLVELFTSEGCSSCPPADSWLAKLESSPSLWQRIAPIGLHVDYWDQLGWRDRFASPSNTARQRNYVRVGSANGVYTPGWFIDGKEWRGWFNRQALPANTGARVGGLRLTIDGEDVYVQTLAPELANKADTLHVALVGVGLTSEIRRGENEGRTLNHAFVQLANSNARFIHGEGRLRLANRLPSEMPRRRAVVAWVTTSSDPTPLQAVGGWLPTTAELARR